MRRSLVLTDEGARHPFRASLPPLRMVDKSDSSPQFWRLTANDVRGVATTYFATFAATIAFLV